jgi:hypothetical protein
MAFLDWMKTHRNKGAQSERGERQNDISQAGIRPIWQPEPYRVRSSGYLVQPCVGWSEKGYHAGLLVKSPQGEAITQWCPAVASKGRATAEAHSAFSGWLESHEAHLDYAKESHRRSRPSCER